MHTLINKLAIHKLPEWDPYYSSNAMRTHIIISDLTRSAYQSCFGQKLDFNWKLERDHEIFHDKPGNGQSKKVPEKGIFTTNQILPFAILENANY